MLVEDNPGDMRMIRELLNGSDRLPCKLEWVDRVAPALERLSRPGVDLVLLDLTLPDRRGIDTFVTVHEAAPMVPVVVLTGSPDDELGREAVRRGAQDFLDKNEVTAAVLARALPYAVERGQLLARQKQVEEELRTRTRQLEGVTGALTGFLEKNEWERAGQMLVSQARELTGSPAGFLACVMERRYLRMVAPAPPEAHDVPELVELTGELALLSPLIDSGAVVMEHGERTALAVPLKRGGEVAAVLYVGGRATPYGERERAQLEVLARAGELLYECHCRVQQEAALEERLRMSQKMEAVGTLASGIAHHFNNLLTIMMGNSQLIMKKCPPDAPLRRNAESISSTGKRAAELIQQILTFHKIQGGRARELDLNDVTGETLKLLRCVVPERIKLRYEPYGRPSPVLADPSQLEQILMNLVVNARDAMDGPGEIFVETSHVNVDATTTDPHLPPRHGRWAMVSVSDTGCGMVPEVLSRIFEPFYTTKEQGRGTGLGLFSVYGVVQQSGGHISVDSEPGRGSTFRVFLPRAELPLVTLPATPVAMAPVARGNETILVVDDDREMRHVVSSLLRRSGYTVIEAAHGGEALSLAERRDSPIDLLVTDVVMPHMSGLELARRLESLSGDLKVLYMSPRGEATPAEPAASRAVTLVRPFDELTLATRVRELLDGPRA